MEKWELIDKIDKIIEKNCDEVPYEGTYVDKSQLQEDILNLIEDLIQSK